MPRRPSMPGTRSMSRCPTPSSSDGGSCGLLFGPFFSGFLKSFLRISQKFLRISQKFYLIFVYDNAMSASHCQFLIEGSC